MKCFFDENLGSQLADGLKGFGEDAVHILEEFDPGTPDVVWLPFVAEGRYILFTVDKRIRRRPLEKALIKKYKIGVFFLGGKTMGRWNYIRQIICNWHKIEAKVNKETPPFAYQISPQGRQITKIPLD
jgi:hypothetical protein